MTMQRSYRPGLRLSGAVKPVEMLWAVMLAIGLLIALLSSNALASPAAKTLAAKKVAKASLVMVEEPGCPYCAQWHAEIGGAYHNTDEGKFAPLTTIYIHGDAASKFRRVVFTPTFIVVSGGREIGRISGYPGSNFFYPLLADILAKAGYEQ